MLVEETMDAARKELGERDRLTLALRNGFGGDLRANGNFPDALKLDEEYWQTIS